MSSFYLLLSCYSRAADALDAIGYQLVFCYFFVEQLEIIERSLWLLATQNNLTINGL